jgi:DNA-binding NarL/FixJ family response regulator
MKLLIKILTLIKNLKIKYICSKLAAINFDKLKIGKSKNSDVQCEYPVKIKYFTSKKNMIRVHTNTLAMSQNLPQYSLLKILVIDDHQLILNGTFNVLQKQYPDAVIVKAKTVSDAIEQIAETDFELIVMDLSIPEQAGAIAQIDTGIKLLQQLFKEYPQQKFLVQSSYVKALGRIKHEIDEHEGGFAIADKGLSESEMLIRANLALQGATHTKDIKTALELKPEWLEVLKLAFEQGLTDRQIALKMHKSERAVRTYWTKIQDVLGVYPEEGKNMRIQTEIRARQEGLID